MAVAGICEGALDKPNEAQLTCKVFSHMQEAGQAGMGDRVRTPHSWKIRTAVQCTMLGTDITARPVRFRDERFVPTVQKDTINAVIAECVEYLKCHEDFALNL